jgi:L-alanine-DL-glutamate epimerase-like enolase superfamily enzyme
VSTIVGIDVRVVVVPDVELKWNDALPALAPTISVVRIVADDGTEGYGSTWLPGPLHEVTDAVEQYLAPQLVGRDVTDRESLWQSFQKLAYFTSIRRAVSVVDIALWDLAAKSVGLPLYRLLGACRDRLPAYASVPPHATVEGAVADALDCRARGFHGFKLHSFGAPARDIEACRAVRDAVGPAFALMLDPVNGYTFDDAFRVGRALDDLDFAWFEAPLPDDDVSGYAALRSRLAVPVANGEVRIRSVREYGEFLQRDAVDIVRCAADVQGGLTALRKVGALAEAFGRRLEPRCYGSTMVQSVHLHWALSVANCAYYEVPEPRGWLDFGMRTTIDPDGDGMVGPPAGNGLGVDVDWDVIDDATVLRTGETR